MTNLLKYITCVLLLLLAPLGAVAAELTQGEKDTIFIGELKIQPSVLELAEKQGRTTELKRLFNSLETQFITSLNATRVFQLVERKRKADLELEQGFAAVSVDPDDKNAAQSGKMAGAKFAFLPQIDGFEDKSDSVSYQAIGRSSMSRKIFLSVVVQIVDTTTGKLLPDSPSVQLTKNEELENVRLGQATGSDQVMVELAKEMAQKLSQEVVSLLRPAKVLTVTGKQVMFNRGTESGFEKGDLIEIYATQKIQDEDSGELFLNEIPVGQAIITRLDKKQSFASIEGENLGIIKGAIVRKLKGAAHRGGGGDNHSREAKRLQTGESDAGESTPGSSEKPLQWK